MSQDVANQKHGVVRYCIDKRLLEPVFIEDTASGKTDWRVASCRFWRLAASAGAQFLKTRLVQTALLPPLKHHKHARVHPSGAILCAKHPCSRTQKRPKNCRQPEYERSHALAADCCDRACLAEQKVRSRPARCRQHQPTHTKCKLLLPAGPLGLRQKHHAAHDCWP